MSPRYGPSGGSARLEGGAGPVGTWRSIYLLAEIASRLSAAALGFRFARSTAARIK